MHVVHGTVIPRKLTQFSQHHINHTLSHNSHRKTNCSTIMPTQTRKQYLKCLTLFHCYVN